ncbi:MAG TPA: NUDIX hydrolase [Rhizomicrobium sp.]
MTGIVTMKTVFAGWLKLSIAVLCGDDGTMFERIVEQHGNGACVLPYDPQRKTAILVRQFRAPVRAVSPHTELLEAIAGLVDENEDPQATAVREAFEEAGLKLGSLDCIGTAWTMPGISTERMSLYLARYTLTDRVGRAADARRKTSTSLSPNLRWRNWRRWPIRGQSTISRH